MEDLTLEGFRDLHAPQLQAIGFPQSLVPALCSKLSGSLKNDPGGCFDICPVQSTDGVSSSTGYVLKSKIPLQPKSDVFVIQHVWESDGGSDARKQLFDDPQLLVKVEDLLGIESGEPSDTDQSTIRDEMVNIVCKQSGKSEKVARRALSDTSYDLTAAIVTAENLTDVDCQDTETKSDPDISFGEFKRGMMTMTNVATTVPDSDLKYLYEDYLKQKTIAPVEDSNGIVQCGSYSWVDHYTEESIIVTIPLPPGTKKKDIVSKIRPRHWTVGIRGSKPIIDQDLTSIVVPEESFWTLDTSEGISMTFQKAHPEESWKALLVGEVQLSQKEVEKVTRIAAHRLAGRVQVVMERMWLVNQTYQAVTPKGDQKPVWYLMDKHGLGLTHSDTPNFSCRPFANAVSGNVMSLVWPVREVKEGEVCTRDFVPLLYPGESSEQQAARREAIFGPSAVRSKKLSQRNKDLPKPSTHKSKTERPILNPSQEVKLYVNGSLKDWGDIKGYTLVTSTEEADIILGDVATTSPRQFVARLVGDECLVKKTRLCQVARGKDWFAQGVDLRTETAAILCEEPLVKTWRIVLPGERGAPIQCRVTRNKVEMIRCVENGPCVASQFCLLTALHDNRRYCLQFSVVVKHPKVFLHSCPRVRVAEKNAADFDPWDTAALLTSSTVTVQWVDFVKQFTSTYKASWTDVQNKVSHAIRELFSLALPNCTGTTAVYSVDILLKHPSLDPVVIGVDPLPAFSNSAVAKQCLDLLVGRTAAGDEFEQLLP